jgi:hypothetical protein
MAARGPRAAVRLSPEKSVYLAAYLCCLKAACWGIFAQRIRAFWRCEPRLHWFGMSAGQLPVRAPFLIALSVQPVSSKRVRWARKAGLRWTPRPTSRPGCRAVM